MSGGISIRASAMRAALVAAIFVGFGLSARSAHADAAEAKKIFTTRCTACHTYLGTGSSNQGAPDLSAEGKKGRNKQFFMQYIRDPSKFGNNVMPKFGFNDQQLSQLAAFLLASKGPK